MKPLKNSIPTMLLGLVLVVSAAGMAQTTTQGDQNQKAETCCSMESCCCNNGSCPMKAEGTTDAGAKTCGDSCKMKHDEKKHDGKHDCCKIKNKSKAKQKAA
jgi:hypothetical protein